MQSTTRNEIPVVFDDGTLPADFVITSLVLLVAVASDFRVEVVNTEDGPTERTTEFRWIEALLTDGTDTRGMYGHDKAWQHDHVFECRGPLPEGSEADRQAEAFLARIKASGRLTFEHVKSSEHWREYDKPRLAQRLEDEWIREGEERLAWGVF